MKLRASEVKTKVERPKVGVSSCLLGLGVRYDGGSRCDVGLVVDLHDWAEIVPICPEVEAGLGAPRAPIKLLGIENTRAVIQTDGSEDCTDKLMAIGAGFVDNNRVAGLILKSKSPSCAVQSAELFEDGAIVSNNGAGIFTRELRAVNPQIPVEESDNLVTEPERNAFRERVEEYAKKALLDQ